MRTLITFAAFEHFDDNNVMLFDRGDDRLRPTLRAPRKRTAKCRSRSAHKSDEIRFSSQPNYYYYYCLQRAAAHNGCSA